MLFNLQARVLYDFSATGPGELSVCYGEEITVVDQSIGEGWWSIVNAAGETGLVPSSYLETLGIPEPGAPPPAIYTQHVADDDWDSDDGYSRHAEPNQGQAFLAEFARSSMTLGIASAVSDPSRLNPIRKGFSKYGSKAGSEEFLLQLERPENAHFDVFVDYVDGLFQWRPHNAPVTCKIGAFNKSSKLHGMKSFVNYRLTCSLITSHVDRRYKQFDWLHARLTSKCPVVCLPSLPEKTLKSAYDEEFLEERRKWLQWWLDWCCGHPVISKLAVFRHFLSSVDEKRWKQGKREAETDRLQSMRFFFTVQSNEGPVPEDCVMDSVDQMDKFNTEILRVLRMFQTTLADFHQRMSANSGKDFLNLSEIFFCLARTFDTDVHSKKILRPSVSAFSNVGESVKSISLHHSVRPESTVALISCLQEYCNLFTSLPSVLALARSACVTLEEAKRLESEGKLSRIDAINIQAGCRVITRSVQAECNFLLTRLQQDLTKLVGTYLRSQVAFYRQLSDQLDAASALFSS